MKIIKVSRTNKRVMIVHEKQTSKKGPVDHVVIESREMPLPSFDTALQALVPFALDILELNGIVDDGRVTIKGLSLSNPKDTLNAIMTCSIMTHNAPAPFTVNTPRMPETSDDSFNLGTKCATAIANVVAEAVKYVKGERAQGTLLGDDEDDDEDEDEKDTNQGKLSVLDQVEQKPSNKRKRAQAS